MRRLLLCSLLLLSGCGLFSSTPVVHRLADNAFEIPVVPSKMDTSGFMASSADSTAPDMIITVPASDKPTVVEVRKTKRTIMDKVMTNKPVFEVKSSTQGVQAAQEKKTLWWRRIAVVTTLLFIAAALVVAVIQRVVGRK